MTNTVEIASPTLKLQRREVERVGLTYYLARRNKNAQCEQDKHSDSEEKLLGAEQEIDIVYLKSLDPKDWKDQDHYKVLGLDKLRFNATDDDIRRAYRRIVLQHHPDKRKAKGEAVITDDDYFTCITKAYEILGATKSRRAYDSVDPDFDNSLPMQNEIDNNYYEIFNKYFDLNARWSEKKNVPAFGDDNAKREDVERFYNFWYDFKSWREFSYLDEEDKEKGQDRDERRWIEKENKAARIKRKKEEMARVRALVDLAYNNDKRILKFKNEEKERKAAIKRAKMDAVQAQKAEVERAAKEVQLAKERAEKAEQKRIEQIRIEKEQQKKILKKERKTLRDKAKECKFFTKNEKDTIKHMEGIEKICETFTLIELQDLNKEIEKKGKDAFIGALKCAEHKIAAELEEINQTHQRKMQNNNKSDVKEIKKAELWSPENMQLLIKAVNIFPAGTAQRWDVIAAYINQHTTGDVNITARDVLNKAKALQSSDFSRSSLKTQANEGAFESFEKSKKEVQTSDDITVNNSINENQIGITKSNSKNNCKENGEVTKPKQNGVPSSAKSWSKEEQALLEQAIKTYPLSTPERWDRIAECIPNRTKKECLKRVKELVDLVNSKKEAQHAVK